MHMNVVVHSVEHMINNAYEQKFSRATANAKAH